MEVVEGNLSVEEPRLASVPMSASAADIKKAFILRTKMMHPDRFSQTKQRAEWELANEMLKELNVAYDALKDHVSRREYDAEPD